MAEGRANEPFAWETDTRELRVWLRLLSCTNLVLHRLRRNLKDGFSVTLPRFDLLAQVARPPLGITLGELSRRLLVTKGNITDIVIRLEKEGLIERRKDEADGRIQHVYLTDAGEEMLEEMLVAHNQWLKELMRPMSDEEKDALMDALGVLKAALKKADAQLADAAGMDDEPAADAAAGAEQA
jgi:DNA-binding MarR family transcriptional regulator